MSIAYKNDEINILDCQYSNVNRCILDENNNQKMSCIIMNYLSSHDYKLVSRRGTEYLLSKRRLAIVCHNFNLLYF